MISAEDCVALCGLVFAEVFRTWLDMAHPGLDPAAMTVLRLARDRPTSALEFPLAGRLRAEVLPTPRDRSRHS